MIYTRELRIGNIVHLHVEKADVRVKVLNGKTIEVSTKKGQYVSYASNYDPVPITEEWLLRFGFEKPSVDQFRLNFNDMYWMWYLFKGKSVSLDDKELRNCTWLMVENSCRYVHQLQNLYFALTGKELQIKEL